MTSENLFDTLVVVKRSGQRTSFQGEKIAIAIQKAFGSIDIPYKDEDVNKIYSKVLNKINNEYKDRKTINIENIQDIIEETLKSEKMIDVYEAFKNYREKRAASRKAFVTKQQHKFLKAIEFLGLDELNEKDSIDTKLTLNRFGNIISTEFTKAYLLDNKSTRNHDSGLIYIDSLETMAMGEIENLEISINDLLLTNTELKEKLINCKTIEEYLSEIKIILANLKKEIYGSICLTAFDKDLEEISLNSYKIILKEYFEIFLKTSNLDSFISLEKLYNDIDEQKDIENIEYFKNYYKDTIQLKNNFELIIDKANKRLEETITKNLNNFFKELNIDISINYGTSTTTIGKLLISSITKASINSKNISYFFKVNKETETSLLLEEYKQKNLKMNNFNYIFLNTSFNKIIDEEVCYFKNGERVIEDNTTIEKKLTSGKGNIASCSINITRLAIKNSYLLNKTTNLRMFYQELDKLINSAKDALLERFDINCTRNPLNFPYLYKNGLWHDGEKIKETDRLRKLLKHGTLTISFCGLKEALYALEKDESLHIDLAKEIIKYMAKKINNISDENNLNFTLSTVVSENTKTEFKKQDTAIYGKLKNITDSNNYLDAHKFSNEIKDIKYLHKYSLGGHLYQTTFKTKKELDKLILESNNNIGSINLKKI